MNTMIAATPSTKIQHGKCTLYFSGLMGIVKVEAKDASTDVRPYAQYARGVYCAFRRARERLARGFVQSFQPSLLILEGWGHPEPDGIFEDAPPVAAGEAVSQRGRLCLVRPAVVQRLQRADRRVHHQDRREGPRGLPRARPWLSVTRPRAIPARTRKGRAFGGMSTRRYTLPEARLILTHVYCVGHLPDGGGWVYPWARSIAGEPLCCRCTCDEPRDLRLYVASTAEAAMWLERENAAIDAHNATDIAEAAQ